MHIWLIFGTIISVATVALSEYSEYQHTDKRSHGVRIVEDDFGVASQPITNEIVKVRRFTLSNKHGITIQIITYGATMTSFFVPDRYDQSEDVLLGFDNIDGYTDTIDREYFGATLGRVCNRIGNNGSFELDGVFYQLTQNDNKNTIHGGTIGFDKFIWDAQIENNKVIMTHVNPDGFQGFPGEVTVTVTFELKADNKFSVKYEATSSKPTPINLSNHAYFNLAGHNRGYAELFKHTIQVNADQITETDVEQIPTGNFINVTGSPYDLRRPQVVVDAITKVPRAGIDDNYCINQEDDDELSFIGSVIHPESGRQLRMYGNQPGVQVYTSNNLPDPNNNIYPPGKPHLPFAPNGKRAIVGKGGALYQKYGAFCLEPLKYPDAVNHPNFASTIIRPGDTYYHHIVYEFSTV